MKSMVRTGSRAVLTSALVLLTLTGCGLFEMQRTEVELVPVTPTESAPATPQVDPALQPTSGSTAVEAAAQLIEIHRDLLESKRFSDACSLYRAEFAGQLADLAGLQGSCDDTLYEAFVAQTDEAFAAAEALGEMPLTPAFFVPSAIAIDATQITADETWLAYVPSSALVSLDTTEFRDGSGLTPAWLARSIYVQLGDDDIWRFAAAAERDNRSAVE